MMFIENTIQFNATIKKYTCKKIFQFKSKGAHKFYPLKFTLELNCSELCYLRMWLNILQH